MTEAQKPNSRRSADSRPDPWTLYWQADNIDSCIPAAGSDDRVEIDAIWHDCATKLPVGAKALDLATGNGTVPLMLQNANSQLTIVAVDKADIDPSKYLSKTTDVSNIEFKGGVDVANLPFDDTEFELVTSQFGIEYAPRPLAIEEAIRVLAPGGTLVLLMHHVDSEILSSAAPLRTEIETLLALEGLLDRVQCYLSSACSLDDLERAGHAYLSQQHIKTPRISGQVFEVINQLVSTPDSKVDGSLREKQSKQARFDTLRHRLFAEHQRLSELRDAALSEADVDAIRHQVQQHDFAELEIRRFLVGVNSNNPALVGWLLKATRR